MDDTKAIPRFAECVATACPRGDGYLVVYAKNSRATTFSFVEAYLRAAEVVVTSLRGKAIVPYDDEIVVPLLSLYVNAIEFTLKVLIERIDEHRQQQSCKSIRTPPQNYQQVLYQSHNLEKLVATAEAMLPGGNSLHAFPDFEECGRFVRDFFGSGITSESTRYVTDANKETYPLYQRQSWVMPNNLHKAVSATCRRIARYATDELHLCGAKEFSRRRIDELTKARDVMTLKSSLFRKLGGSEIDMDNQMPLANASSVVDFESQGKREGQILAAIEGLNHEDLAALVMGLYFTRSPSVVEDQDFFCEWEESELKQKIVERAHCFDAALEALKAHIVGAGQQKGLRTR
jgi:hypothetical protein